MSDSSAKAAIDGNSIDRPASSSRRLAQISTVMTWVMHATVLLVFVVPFTWKALALALATYLVRMWGITAGYHRYFSHRAFKTSRAFQFVLGWLGTSAMQNGPLWWASWHRRHHKHSDTPEDTHSPRQKGFWHAHMGWFMDGTHEDPDLGNVKDLAKYPEIRWLEKRKWVPLVVLGVACYLVGGASGLVWGFFVSTIAVLQVTMCINSLAHVWGTRRYETNDDSRNNAVLAFFALGEGWHNNHHHSMSAARSGERWWEIDVTWYVLRVLAAVGVVWDLRAPRVSSAERDGRGVEPLEEIDGPVVDGAGAAEIGIGPTPATAEGD
jgi:stearoyl-CoA desaturase (Delta-9 desaturase)